MTKKCHENSGGYALCLLYIVMCAILRVVAYFLSVKLLHMTKCQKVCMKRGHSRSEKKYEIK